MKRDYTDGVNEGVTFFVGTEVEHTPAYGMKTLFVVGIHNEQVIIELARGNDCEHIFFGANHSFNPAYNDYEGWKAWEEMIQTCLDQGFLCSLDIPLSAVEEFNDGGLNDHNNFIPQIKVPVPYLKLWNYNTMIKIDDKDFNATNPGVWSIPIGAVTQRKYFTAWREYKNDVILK
jgi:hypothetical protein